MHQIAQGVLAIDRDAVKERNVAGQTNELVHQLRRAGEDAIQMIALIGIVFVCVGPDTCDKGPVRVEAGIADLRLAEAAEEFLDQQRRLDGGRVDKG